MSKSLVPLGLTAGAVVGTAIYELTRLSGFALFAAIGAAMGGSAPFLSHRYRGWLRMTELTVHVPQFSDLTFSVDDDGRLVAWQLYVEVATRISTQPIGAEDGTLREALNSLYLLFTSTREVLKSSRPSTRTDRSGNPVEQLAITMLNLQLRPFLSRWHSRLAGLEATGQPESEWPFNGQCRAELAQVSQNILEYAFGFAKLANVGNAEEVLKAKARIPPSPIEKPVPPVRPPNIGSLT